jgi:hypothetical protein
MAMAMAIVLARARVMGTLMVTVMTMAIILRQM